MTRLQPWRLTGRSPTWRIEEAASVRLIEKFSGTTDSSGGDAIGDPEPKPDADRRATASTNGESVIVSIDGDDHRLDPETAARLRSAIGDALVRERTFLRTAAERRADGSYVVRRRAADSDGHRKVFESHDAVAELFDSLPDHFGATDLERDGLSGSRRHMLLRHLVEHPGFPCELASRQPLTARKVEESELGIRASD